jgi:hypothetical protein
MVTFWLCRKNFLCTRPQKVQQCPFFNYHLEPGLPDFALYNIPKRGKYLYQMATKYVYQMETKKLPQNIPKLPQNIPNGRE